MVGWHHRLNGLEFEQAPRGGDGQRNLACCSPWGHKESDTTDWLNWTDPLQLEKKWQPNSVFLPGKSHGRRSLAGHSPWGCRVRHDWGTELNWTEAHSQGSKCFYTDNNRLLRVISQNIKTISIFSWSPNNCARWTHCQRVQPCRPRGPQCAAHHCPQWFSALWLSPLLWGSQPFPYIRNTQGILSKDTDALNPLLTFSFHCWDKSPRVSGLLNIRQSQFLVVYWLRLCAPSGGGLGFISGQETRSHMPQLKILYEDPVPPNKLNKQILKSPRYFEWVARIEMHC